MSHPSGSHGDGIYPYEDRGADYVHDNVYENRHAMPYNRTDKMTYSSDRDDYYDPPYDGHTSALQYNRSPRKITYPAGNHRDANYNPHGEGSCPTYRSPFFRDSHVTVNFHCPAPSVPMYPAYPICHPPPTIMPNFNVPPPNMNPYYGYPSTPYAQEPIDEPIPPINAVERRSPVHRISPSRSMNRKWSLDRRWSPRRSPDRRWSPRRSSDYRGSPKRSPDRRWSPKRSSDYRGSPRRFPDRRWSPRRSPSRTQWSPDHRKSSSHRLSPDYGRSSPHRSPPRHLSPSYRHKRYARSPSPHRKRSKISPAGSSKHSRDRRSPSRYRRSPSPRRSRDERRNKDKYYRTHQSRHDDDKTNEEQPEHKWTRSTPAELYYTRDTKESQVVRGTEKVAELCEKVKDILIDRASRAKKDKPPYEPAMRRKPHLHKCSEVSSSSSDSDSTDFSEDETDCSMRELDRKRRHPDRLHQELWFNDPGEMNDGPLCRCSAKARRSGIRHGIYAGEAPLPPCDPNSNNADKLYHYRITISPPTNFLTKVPTIISYDEHEFIFEGFSMFSHVPLAKLPTCKVIRFNIQYTILYVEEKPPTNFTVQELNLFFDYVFRELLELADLNFKAAGDVTGCPKFHFMPRFVRDLPDKGIEILSMSQVLQYLLDQNKPLIEDESLATLLKMPQFEWQNLADEVKGMLVTYPGSKPCSLRVDQIDREQQNPEFITYPEIVHFGIRPPQLSYAGNPDYQREWREYVKLRHLLANMPKPSFEDKRRLESKENKLQEMRMLSRMKRDVTVAVSAKGFFRTGIMCDIIQHSMLVPVLVCHLRFHQSLDKLEQVIDYKFKNRYLLQLALTHPSYRENFGTNPDHARNSLTNCGIRQPEYGDRRIHYLNTRKRGINTLINIMSRFGKKCETESNITHNERLEFLGDAVVEFLTSIHLFFMFPDIEEGGLATYRAAIVQNQHLAVLAKNLKLEEYMLYAHGSDLCHDLELRHAMANCFEALMGALFLDGGIKVADKVFASTFLGEDPALLDTWVNCPRHPLQLQEPQGDRHWISQFTLLQELTKFEESIGVEFTHMRLLARAFTDRSIGYTNLTLGSNQRLEFLGDTVLQLIASDYLYKHFPEHHEGHLSLLRSSLVNNRTQAVVCDDLGMTKYAIYSNPKAELKTKDRADLLEAFLGALYVDKNMEFCIAFCNVCFFPRLQDFIMNQDWNDPKSKLQQCCLTLRTMDGGEPDIPIYKVIECKGPTNTRIYTVAVYFRGDRLATATGHSIQQAEMNAAKCALQNSGALFPQLHHQKRVIAKSMKKQRRPQQYRSNSLSDQEAEKKKCDTKKLASQE